MITCKELRARARNSLDFRIFGKTWLFTIVAILIFGGILFVAGFVPLGLGLLIVSGPLLVGLCTYLLNSTRYMYATNHFMDIFRSFKVVRRYFLTLLMGLYLFLWSLLFVIPGIVKLFSYSLTPFIMADEPELTVNHAITKSRKMMDGYKGQLFKLMLSFIGWFFVSAIFLPALPWVIAYVVTTLAEFYDYVKKDHNVSIW